MTQLESLHADAFSAIALRYLAAGQVRLYEHLCKQPWFHAPSLLQVLDKAKATLPPGIEPKLHPGEAESAANLATFYEQRYFARLLASFDLAIAAQLDTDEEIGQDKTNEPETTG